MDKWRQYGPRVKSWLITHRKESVFAGLLIVVLVVGMIAAGRAKISGTNKKADGQPGKAQQSRVASQAPTDAPSPVPTATFNPEEKVYSYLQGPKSWKERRTWSGAWGELLVDGGSFGGFGCGLCCVANLYSTHAKYKASPLDAYRFSKKHTGYGGGCAIAWEQMQSVLNQIGFDALLRHKPSDYADFQRRIAAADSAIVLVSSYDSTCYWKDTPGHYVTVYLYNKDTDKVFLADSGDPAHNRHWVALKKIYKSLKTSSDYQYMTVSNYRESADQWKHKKASGDWITP